MQGVPRRNQKPVHSYVKFNLETLKPNGGNIQKRLLVFQPKGRNIWTSFAQQSCRGSGRSALQCDGISPTESLIGCGVLTGWGASKTYIIQGDI